MKRAWPGDSGVDTSSGWGENADIILPVDDLNGASRAMLVGCDQALGQADGGGGGGPTLVRWIDKRSSSPRSAASG